MAANTTAEQERLYGDSASWKRWGPYLSERAWGTVREDYSPYGTAWDYFPHDHARSRAYRWNEDGLAGISDSLQRLCFALALWNGRDAILKERLFGLTGSEGNHGEDVKEYYFYLDSTPTHSYMKMLYKYPQAAFPYADLVEINRRRGKQAPEYELVDTGVFAENRYFDVCVEYAKAGPRDILVRISATNRGPEPAELHLLPTLWFRNTWSWGINPDRPKPTLRAGAAELPYIVAEHYSLGTYVLACDRADTEESPYRPTALYGDSSVSAPVSAPTLLFTENETNLARLYGAPNSSPYVKDGIGDAVVNGRADAVNPAQTGTKAAAHYHLTIGAGETATIRLRLRRLPNEKGKMQNDGNGAGYLASDTAQNEKGKIQNDGSGAAHFASDILHFAFKDFDEVFAQRIAEANEFYAALQPESLSDDERLVQRQAFAGMLWSKQFYYYDVDEWLKGDPAQPPPPPERGGGRNRDWRHLNNADIISMPDKWEYPWFAAWDLAFHCLSLALVDPEFAKEQLILLGREWYQHPNGQIPAYEWAFSDVNPPVMAWAAWRVYKIDQKMRGQGDRLFLERAFHKLMLNFVWWVNRKDAEGKNVFQGGFLGLDNIGVFDRSQPLPTGGRLEQSDGTSWMGMFCLNMLTIALELACADRAYEDIATKFFEHFLYIAEAMNNIAGEGIALWDEADEFFYDVLSRGPGDSFPLKIRSMVGLIPLYAVITIEPALLDQLPEFKERMEWFLKHRPQLAALVSRWQVPGEGERRLLAICRGHRMKRVLARMLDETEFLSDYGVRAISRYHHEHPYMLDVDGARYEVRYLPGESDSGLFGGNSNWRGPIWMPVNYLLIESLQQFHHYYGDDFKIECPAGSGQLLTLREIADELSLRLMRIFLRDRDGRRAVFGETRLFQEDPHWRDFVPFHEYFHGDTGAGVGASHQTGWTGLIAKLIQQQGEHPSRVTLAAREELAGEAA